MLLVKSNNFAVFTCCVLSSGIMSTSRGALLLLPGAKSAASIWQRPALKHANTAVQQLLISSCVVRRQFLPSAITSRHFSSSGQAHQRSEHVLAGPTSHDAPSKGISIGSLNPLKWIKDFYAEKGEELYLSKHLYESCAEKVDFDAFYKAFDMPDTFHSWFVVLQLHVWMLLLRLKQEGSRGKHVYHNLVQLMWYDVEERMKLLKVYDATVRKNSLKELVEEFHGCIVAFDEGILSDDRVLAAALWRNFVHDKRRTNPTSLADLVSYVREQVSCLDNVDFERLLKGRNFEWVTFGSASKEPPTFMDDVG